MLWYLHLVFEVGIVVLDYEDAPLGHGESVASGVGRFAGATLRPVITLATGTDPLAADAVHGKIHEVCLIARSVNFPVDCDARYLHE